LVIKFHHIGSWAHRKSAILVAKGRGAALRS
jgi:hypothetical protein